MTLARFRIRRDTAADWTSVNPILQLGEPGLETDTRKVKYGDGVTAWNSLAYSGGGVTSVSVVTANGISGSVANPTTTPAITLTIGAVSLASATGLSLTTGVTGTLPVANGGTGVTTSTGTGSTVRSGSPTFTGTATFNGIDSSVGNVNFSIVGGYTVGVTTLNGLIRYDQGPVADAAELNFRPTATKKGFISFTHEAAADRWSIGIKGSDANLYFSDDRNLASVRMTLASTGLDVAGEVRCDSFWIDQAATAGTFTATHYLTINLNGTAYRIPCAI